MLGQALGGFSVLALALALSQAATGCSDGKRRARAAGAVDGGGADAEPMGPGAVRLQPGEGPGAEAAPMASVALANPARVRMVIDGEPANLNPDLDPDVWTFRIAHDSIYEPLLRPRSDTPVGTRLPGAPGRPDRGGAASDFEGVLALRFTVEDEGRRIMFHLRPGVTFHDGHPLTSVDVAFTFDRLRSGKTRAPRMQASLADLDRVELVGRETVRFTTRRPSAFLLSAIADVSILPEHVFGKGDLNYQSANRRPVGTGPFRLGEWERGKRITLVRSESYWGEKPHADAIEILIESDAVRALGRAQRGELDVLGHVPAAYVPEQLDSPALRSRYQAVRTETTRFAFVVWNTQHPPLDDVRVRRAIALAVDRKRLLEDTRHSVGRAIASAPLEAAKTPRSDLAEAQLALDGAGLPRGPGGFRHRAPGRPIRLTVLAPVASHEAEVTAKRLHDVLVKLGMTVDVVMGDLATLLGRLRKGTFDGALLEWAARDGDDIGTLVRTHGAFNFGGFSSHEVDQLIDALHRPEVDPGAPREVERRALRERLSAALASEQPMLFLYTPDQVYLYSRRLREARRRGDFFLLRDLGPR